MGIIKIPREVSVNILCAMLNHGCLQIVVPLIIVLAHAVPLLNAIALVVVFLGKNRQLEGLTLKQLDNDTLCKLLFSFLAPVALWMLCDRIRKGLKRREKIQISQASIAPSWLSIFLFL